MVQICKTSIKFVKWNAIQVLSQEMILGTMNYIGRWNSFLFFTHIMRVEMNDSFGKVLNFKQRLTSHFVP